MTSGRVVRVLPDAAAVSFLGQVRTWPVLGTAVRVGDLVELSNGYVHLVAENTSQEPIESQDWWRLHRIAPFLADRSRIESDIRGWFQGQGFLDVTTPCLGVSPGLEVHLRAIPADLALGRRYLMTSPEYHMKRLLSAGFPKIVYHGRAFRDDEAGVHHHAEFTILEWYRAGASPDEIMADVEALVALATGQRRTWTTITVAEALERFAAPTGDPDVVLRHLVERVEPALAGMGAVFLTKWPRALASLARLSTDDPRVSERFEAYVDGVELANGFGELTDPVEQRARLEDDVAHRRALGLEEYPIDERFLDALHAGLPPCTGIALGLDRLVMLATGAKHLDDVVPFSPFLA